MSLETRSHLAFLLLGIVAYFLLLPGTHGVFLLDDLPNLKPLERVTDAQDWLQIAGFALSGGATPLGRAIPMASFALQASDWPNAPETFKQVNLFLHLLNGVLIYCLFYRIGKFSNLASGAAAVLAFFSAAVWLLHPLNLSTVFYVIQRMTEMSTTFMLLGLLTYLRGRRLILEGRSAKGYFWASAGILGGTVLAVLCKEIGVLLPLYALVLELTLLRNLPRTAGWTRWTVLCLAAPLLAALAYGIGHWQSWVLVGYQQRPFSLTERLMTEPRMLWSYVAMIFAPQSGLLGLFHDDVAISKSLAFPPVTAVAVVSLAVTLVAALLTRKRYPLFAFGVFWFMAGHLIESTVLPLELYFEHRNYLPMAGIIYAVTRSGASWAANIQRPGRLGAWLGAGWLLILAAVTWQQSQLWGAPARQALQWAKSHPDSPRAQQNLAGLLVIAGQPDRATAIYRRLAERDDGNPGGYLLWLAAACRNIAVTLPDRGKLMSVLRTSTQLEYGAVGVLESMISDREDGGCRRLDPSWINQSIAELLENPRYAAYRSGLYVLAGRLNTTLGNTDHALSNFDQSLAITPNVEVVLLKVKAMASAGRYREAYGLMSEAYAVNQRYSPPIRKASYAQDIGIWEQRLIEKLK